jgi:uncharacterized protein (DUF885 family)
MKRVAGLAAALVLALAACGSPPPPEPPPAPVTVPPPPGAGGGASAPDPRKASALFDRILDAWLEDEPAMGRMLGLHAYDGRVADTSAAAVQKRIQRLESARKELGALDRAALTPDEALDQAILLNAIDVALFELVDVASWQTRPAFYKEMFEVDSYVNRNYAPIEERARRLLDHERAGLARAGNALANLKSPMSRPVVETAIKIYRGYAEYLRGDVVKIMGGVGDAAFKADFAKTNEALAKKAEEIATHLDKVEKPKGDESHVLGPEKFSKLLRAQEGLEIGLDEFRKMGEDNLLANKKAYVELRPKVKTIARPKATELLAEATRLTESSRRFVLDRKIATIPSDDRAEVRETPPYMRWNSAFLDMPGPFDTAKESFYYITMPDPTWPAKEQAAYVMDHGTLLSTTVHEVYPGHFLQGLWIKRAPTRVQKALASYSFAEGWAHYIEQMMIEEGFGADNPQNHLGQLSDALLRNCRMVVSVGVHAQKMTLAQAEKRFSEDCFQDKATAREQAVRATFDPGYFAYTLGKIQILQLREEAKKRMGARFTLQRFHDALLAHGSPPLPLVRDRVLAELAK